MTSDRLDDRQVGFIRAYILPGFTLPKTKPQDHAPLPDQARRAKDIWIEAKESVDKRLEVLQRTLRDIDDPNCQLIADKGLHGVTRGLQVKMMAALMDAQNAPADREKDARSSVLTAVESFAAMIGTGPEIEAIEDLAALPEIGVPVRIRAELSGALQTMQGILKG